MTTKLKKAWYQQNEDTSADGFYLADTEAFRADMALLRDEGAPSTEFAEFVSHEVEDRDEAIIEAFLPTELYDWMKKHDVPFVDED